MGKHLTQFEINSTLFEMVHAAGRREMHRQNQLHLDILRNISSQISSPFVLFFKVSFSFINEAEARNGTRIVSLVKAILRLLCTCT